MTIVNQFAKAREPAPQSTNSCNREVRHRLVRCRRNPRSMQSLLIFFRGASLATFIFRRNADFTQKHQNNCFSQRSRACYPNLLQISCACTQAVIEGQLASPNPLEQIHMNHLVAWRNAQGTANKPRKWSLKAVVGLLWRNAISNMRH